MRNQAERHLLLQLLNGRYEMVKALLGQFVSFKSTTMLHIVVCTFVVLPPLSFCFQLQVGMYQLDALENGGKAPGSAVVGIVGFTQPI